MSQRSQSKRKPVPSSQLGGVVGQVVFRVPTWSGDGDGRFDLGSTFSRLRREFCVYFGVLRILCLRMIYIFISSQCITRIRHCTGDFQTLTNLCIECIAKYCVCDVCDMLMCVVT